MSDKIKKLLLTDELDEGQLTVVPGVVLSEVLRVDWW